MSLALNATDANISRITVSGSSNGFFLTDLQHKNLLFSCESVHFHF